MENFLHICAEGIIKKLEMDISDSFVVWYKHHGIYDKNFVDFHVMIQVFVFAQKRQWHFPRDMQWRGGELIILKQCTIYDAVDELLKRGGFTLDERVAMLDSNHLSNVSLVRSLEVNSPCFQAAN